MTNIRGLEYMLTSDQGIGGDIGGSIRCPAAFVGVYGFKYDF